MPSRVRRLRSPDSRVGRRVELSESRRGPEPTRRFEGIRTGAWGTLIPSGCGEVNLFHWPVTHSSPAILQPCLAIYGVRRRNEMTTPLWLDGQVATRRFPRVLR